MVLRTALMKKLTFLKAGSAVTEKILKATSTDINRLLSHQKLIEKIWKTCESQQLLQIFSYVYYQLSETLL
jgi:hypothetical protein